MEPRESSEIVTSGTAIMRRVRRNGTAPVPATAKGEYRRRERERGDVGQCLRTRFLIVVLVGETGNLLCDTPRYHHGLAMSAN